MISLVILCEADDTAYKNKGAEKMDIEILKDKLFENAGADK